MDYFVSTENSSFICEKEKLKKLEKRTKDRNRFLAYMQKIKK